MTDRAPRAGSFLFDVDRFQNDLVVLAMSPLARAFYALMLIGLWKLPEPGVVPDDDRVLKTLTGADDEQWLQIRNDIRSAFDNQSRPGWLVQHGMVRTHEEQTLRIESHRSRGQLGGMAATRKRKMRRIKPFSSAQAELKQKSSDARQGSGSVSGSVNLDPAIAGSSPEMREAHSGASGAPDCDAGAVDVRALALGGEISDREPGGGEIGAVRATSRDVLTLPCVAGPDFVVTPVMVTEWAFTYPGVDLPQELREMRAWLLANPRRRKTPRGVRAFVTTWLMREQDRAATRAPVVDVSAREKREREERDRLARERKARVDAEYGRPGVPPPPDVMRELHRIVGNESDDERVEEAGNE